MKETTFEGWFTSREWWAPASAEPAMRGVWNAMARAGMDGDSIADCLRQVVSTIESEYGA